VIPLVALVDGPERYIKRRVRKSFLLLAAEVADRIQAGAQGEHLERIDAVPVASLGGLRMRLAVYETLGL
jgi:hypothetical protein